MDIENNSNRRGNPGGSGSEASKLPQVAGFTFTERNAITKIDKVDAKKRPTPREWRELLDEIRDNGAKTVSPTARGRRHPCATDGLRCDHQNVVGDYVNTQCQLGGKTETVNRSDASKESTTISHVEVDMDCYGNNLIGLALANAHGYSYATLKTVRLNLAQGTGIIAAPIAVGGLKFVCNKCGKRYAALDSIALGLSLGGYPPRCSCGGTPVRQ